MRISVVRLRKKWYTFPIFYTQEEGTCICFHGKTRDFLFY